LYLTLWLTKNIGKNVKKAKITILLFNLIHKLALGQEILEIYQLNSIELDNKDDIHPHTPSHA